VGGDDWPTETHVVVVGDRENDIFEHFAAPRPAACWCARPICGARGASSGAWRARRAICGRPWRGGFYCRRWLIERFHYTLKSGCQIEASQLRDVAALQALTTLFCYAAWRLLWLSYLARRLPNEPATMAFTTLEWQRLARLDPRPRHRHRRPAGHRPPAPRCGQCIDSWRGGRWQASRNSS
jgi:hypothetical protein